MLVRTGCPRLHRSDLFQIDLIHKVFARETAGFSHTEVERGDRIGRLFPALFTCQLSNAGVT
jgi:hypothetical protein